MDKAILRIENLKLSVGNKVLFSGVSFDLSASGMVGLMGPMGVGKSSLVSWLCGTAPSGLINAEYDLAEIGGKPLSDDNRPALLPQKSVRSAGEALGLLEGLVARGRPLLCVDEVTALLTPEDSVTVLEWLADLARELPVLMVSHNQFQVATYADTVVLLAGGQLQEVTSTKQFFTAPLSEAGQQFIRTGGTSIHRPDTDPRHLLSELRQAPDGVRVVSERSEVDSSLCWIIRDKLAAYRPIESGKLGPEEVDLLAAKGITAILMIDHDEPDCLDALDRKGILAAWYPLDRAELPDPAEMRAICTECDRLVAAGNRLAVMMINESTDGERTIAAQLVSMGVPAGMAADSLRRAFHDHPLSLDDEQFLWDFELFLDLGTSAAGQTRRARGEKTDRFATEKRNIATFVGEELKKDVGRRA